MVYMILGGGFEELEAVAVCDILRRGDIKVSFVGVEGLSVTGAHGIKITSDCTVSEIDLGNADMIIIPGGLGGVKTIEASEQAMTAIAEAGARGIELAAICAGPRVLAKLGLLKGKSIVCYPGMEREMDGATVTHKTNVIRENGLTTGRGPGDAIDFGLALLEVLRGRSPSHAVARGLCYER